MTDKRAREIIMTLFGRYDYDIAKSLDPKTAEEPAEAKREMKLLVELLKSELKRA